MIAVFGPTTLKRFLKRLSPYVRRGDTPWDVASCRKAQGKCLATRSLPPAVAGPAPAWRRVSLSLPARHSCLCIAPLVIRSRRAMAPKKDDKKGAAKPKAGSGGGKAKKKVRSAAPASRFGSVADWIAWQGCCGVDVP